MDEVLETWTPHALDVHEASPIHPEREAKRHRRLFIAKAVFLLLTTLALIPVLMLQSALGGAIYVGFLVAVHVVGLAVFVWGVRARDMGVGRGLVIRIGGLVLLTALLYLASKGLQTGFASAVFWISLVAIWALHTAGAAMLHLMPSKHSDSLCPFL